MSHGDGHTRRNNFLKNAILISIQRLVGSFEESLISTMRAMRGFISKAFALAVEGDICGFSFLSLSFSLFLSAGRRSQESFNSNTGWGISSRALLRPRFYDTIRNNEEPESAARISYLISFLVRISARAPSTVTSMIHTMGMAKDFVRGCPKLGSSKVS